MLVNPACDAGYFNFLSNGYSFMKTNGANLGK